ncbi:MAG: hypothetical protein KDB66_03215 [Solirubrobacterales bacterium]|nr:hypothetical protein [Solirubrobacterales bacterium]MCB8915254.1 hypothetical protein [Thermoleophilales bacterium]
MKSWQPPLLLIALIVPAALGFALAGPGLGLTIAGLSLVGLVIVAMLVIPRDPIGRTPHPELARRLLVVTTFPIEDAASIQRVADEVRIGFDENEAEIRLLTPAANTFLRRWATDLERARDSAQRDLVVSVASLTLAGVDASASVGDENLVQAVEDELVTFDATEVFLLTRGDPESAAAGQLRERLRPRFRHVDLR